MLTDLLDPSLPLGKMKATFRTKYMLNLANADDASVAALLALFPADLISTMPILGGETTVSLKPPPPPL